MLVKNLQETCIICLLPNQLCKREEKENGKTENWECRRVGRDRGGTHLLVNVENRPWVFNGRLNQTHEEIKIEIDRKRERQLHIRSTLVYGVEDGERGCWKCRLECGVLPPIPVMSFRAKWLQTSKGGIFPDGKASSSRLSHREGILCAPSVWKKGWGVTGVLIKINPKHSYFHKLSARGLFGCEQAR